MGLADIAAGHKQHMRSHRKPQKGGRVLPIQFGTGEKTICLPIESCFAIPEAQGLWLR